MPRSFHLILHLGRKVCVRSVYKDAEIELPAFFRDDEIQLTFTLVHYTAEPRPEAPFEAVDTTGWDVWVAIGNGLSRTARRILPQTFGVRREPDGRYQGELSLQTQKCPDYLQLPDQYAGQASYDIGQQTYFEGLTYRRVAAASDSVPEGSPATSPSLWSSYDLYRDPLYFEVVLVGPEGMETVVQMPSSVLERVIQRPPVSPTLIEDLDALADAMASRLAAGSSVQWEHNATRE